MRGATPAAFTVITVDTAAETNFESNYNVVMNVFGLDENATNLTLTGVNGFLTGAGPVTVGGNFNWSAGANISGTGTLTTSAGSVTTISGLGNGLGRSWVNAGTVNVTADGHLEYFNAPTTFTNNGVFNLDSTVSAPISVFDSSTHVFNNAGTLNKTQAGTQAIGNTNLSFNNTGTTNVQAGTLRLDTGGTDTGLYALSPATTLQFNGGTRNLNAGSDVTGNATVLVSGGVVNVNGSYGIASPKRSFTILTNQTSVVRTDEQTHGRSRGTGSSIFVFTATEWAHKLLGMSDDDIRATYLRDLDEIFPGFSSTVVETQIQRWPLGQTFNFPGRATLQPVFTRDHGRLHLAGDFMGTMYTETAITTGTLAGRDVVAKLAAGN